jgi:hypothetical protein
MAGRAVDASELTVEDANNSYIGRLRLVESCELLNGDAMHDNKSMVKSDRKYISLGEDYEVQDWTKALNTTEERLRAAVKAVGNQPANVREYLTKHKQVN